MEKEKPKMQFTKEAVIGKLKEINKSMEEDIEFYMGQIGHRLDENYNVDVNYNEDLDECVSIWMHHQWDLEEFIEELENAEFDEGCKTYYHYGRENYDLEDDFLEEIDFEEEYLEYERDFEENLDNWIEELGIVEISQEEFLKKYFKLAPTGIVQEYTEYLEENLDRNCFACDCWYFDLDLIEMEGFPNLLLVDSEDEEDDLRYCLYIHGNKRLRISHFASREEAITFVRSFIYLP